MRFIDEDIFRTHADFCRILASPKRLMILAMLGIREMSVGEMAETMGVSLSNASQHLTVLKSRNIVATRKNAQNVYYSLLDPRLIDACNLIRTILLDDLKRRGLVAREIDAEQVVVDE